MITSPRICAALEVYTLANENDWGLRTTIAQAVLNGFNETGRVPAAPDAVPSAIAEEPYSSTWYGAGQLLFPRAEGWHRIALAEGLQDEGTWTLVLTLPPRACSWGFRIRGQKIEHREYFRKEAVRQRARQLIHAPKRSDRIP